MRFFDSSWLKIKWSCDRGAVEALNPPQHGLGLTGMSSSKPQKIISFVQLFICPISFSIYFKQFALALKEIEYFLSP